jgi:hypothetical protein
MAVEITIHPHSDLPKAEKGARSLSLVVKIPLFMRSIWEGEDDDMTFHASLIHLFSKVVVVKYRLLSHVNSPSTSFPPGLVGCCQRR